MPGTARKKKSVKPKASAKGGASGSVVTVHAAKTHLSKLIERACAGEEIVIARGNTPVVRLVPVQQPAPKRKFGTLKGLFEVPDSFFDPLPDDELKLWEGGDEEP